MIVSNTKGGVWNRQLRAPARIQLDPSCCWSTAGVSLRCSGRTASGRCLGANVKRRCPSSGSWAPWHHCQSRPLIGEGRPNLPSILTLECFLGRLMKSVPLTTTTRPGPISQSPAVGYHPVDWTGPSFSGRVSSPRCSCFHSVTPFGLLFPSRLAPRRLDDTWGRLREMRYEYSAPYAAVVVVMNSSYNNMSYSRRRHFSVINNTTVWDVALPPPC